MIVPCSQCHTRFKVPDHRVTARGVKVRCSRCRHTFRVFPEPAPPPGDPFAAFGPGGASDLEKTPARGVPAAALLARAKDPSDDFDVDDSGEAPVPEPAWSFPPAPAPAPSPGESGAAVAVQAVEPVRVPVSVPSPFHAHPDQVRAELAALEAAGDLAGLDAQPEPPPPELPSFAASGDLAALAGFTPAWGVAAPVRALGADGTMSHHHSRLDEAPSSSEPVGSPPPLSPEPASALGPVGTMLDDLPALDDLGPPAGHSLELDLHREQSGWSGASQLAHAAEPFELPPAMGSVELDAPPEPPAAEPASPPPPPPAAALDWDAPFPPAAVRPPAATPAPLSEFGDPFAEPASSAPSNPSVQLDDPPPMDPMQERGMFEMARPGPPAPSIDAGPLLPDIPDLSEPVPGPGSSPTGSISGPFPIGRLSRPPSRTRLGLDDRGEPGTARRVSGFLLNVGIAALLLVMLGALGSGYLSEGRMELSMLSPRRWLAAMRSPSGVSPTDVTNGTYETRSGRALVYVRGRVHNRGEPDSRIRIEAELWDGGKRVKTSDTLAGGSASPEELWMAGTPAEVEALRQKLLAQARGVPTGGEADFLVLFDEVPPELGSLRLRVVTSVARPEQRQPF